MSGRHRRRLGRRRVATDTTTLVVLARPQEAEVNGPGWCPAEEAERLHAFFANGDRQCWTCRTVTPRQTTGGA